MIFLYDAWKETVGAQDGSCYSRLAKAAPVYTIERIVVISFIISIIAIINAKHSIYRATTIHAKALLSFNNYNCKAAIRPHTSTQQRTLSVAFPPSLYQLSLRLSRGR